MKSQINLLHSEFRPQFHLICGAHLVGLVGLAILISTSIYTGLYYMNSQEDVALAKIQKDIADKQQIITELTNELTLQTTNPVLESKLLDLRQQVNDRTLLLKNIKALSGLKQRSFSTMFDGLSEAQDKSLWLTMFKATDSELSLKGVLSSPKALPTWIKQLSTTPFFEGQTFNIASLTREQGALKFELTSSVNETSSLEAVSTNVVARESSDE